MLFYDIIERSLGVLGMVINIDKYDYEYLDEKIEDSLISNCVIYKKANLDGEIPEVKIIRLCDVERFNFSFDETYYVMDYLKSKNIYVYGYSQAKYSIFDNYVNLGQPKTHKDYPKLNKNTQIKLLREFRENGNLESRDALIFSYQKLIERISKAFSYTTGIEITEIESYAYEALIESLNEYDFNTSRLCTYINDSIIYGILNGIRGEYPVGSNDKVKKLNDIRVELKKLYADEDIYNEYDHLDEIIEKFLDKNSSYKVRYRDMQTIRLIYSDSLNDHIDDSKAVDDNTLYNEVLESVYQEGLRSAVLKALDKISLRSPKSACVLTKRFCLDGNNPMTLKEVAKEMNITFQRVNLLEKRALVKLHDSCKFLEEYLKYSQHEYDYNLTEIEYQKVRGEKNGN